VAPGVCGQRGERTSSERHWRGRRRVSEARQRVARDAGVLFEYKEKREGELEAKRADGGRERAEEGI
jgi:hypothetical protein